MTVFHSQNVLTIFPVCRSVQRSGMSACIRPYRVTANHQHAAQTNSLLRKLTIWITPKYLRLLFYKGTINGDRIIGYCACEDK